MMNMICVPGMNILMSEDVNMPSLRNPLNHLGRKQKKAYCREERKGWIDGWNAVCGNH